MPAEANYLLDTSVLVAYIRAGPLGTRIEGTYRLLNAPDKPVISVVSEGEVLSLARQFRWGPATYARLRALLQEIVILDINRTDVIEAYAEIDHHSRSTGRSMGKNDVWIAATARVTGLTILTTDKDFDHLHPGWIQREWIDETGVRRSP